MSRPSRDVCHHAAIRRIRFVIATFLRYLPGVVPMDPDPLRRLFDRRLLLFTGKGGVGKSTVVAALAVEAAARGLHPLIVELGHRATMQDIFSTATGVRADIGHDPVPVTADRKVWAANLDFETAIVDYITDQVKLRSVARAIASNRALQGLFRAAPAVREIVTLNKLRLFERATTRGRPTWGPILVDLDATGHALMLLEMPRMIGELLNDGPLRGLIDALTGLFTDPTRTLLNLVTLPSEIPVQETLELHQRLRREHGVPLGALFVNNVSPPAIASDLRSHLPELAALAAHTNLPDLTADVHLAEQAIARDELALALIARLQHEVDLPLALLPRLAPHEHDLTGLQRLGRAALTPLAAPAVSSSSSSPVRWDMQEHA